jgi:NOL1/NOP2/fmu family ribosome biogenesis protein
MFAGRLAGDLQGLRVLDLCAAPGGKTTLLSTLAGLDGLVVANEPIRARAQTLADNVERWGLGNVVVTNNDPSHFKGFRDWFDVVLVDAPCSGEGMFRRHPEARGQWSEGNVELCARRQRRIVADAWGALKPEGVLIYSTCTFNRAENEQNAAWIADELGGEAVAIDVPQGVEPSGGGYRFWPHRVAGEGFFAAAVRKHGARARRQSPKPRREPLADAPREAVRELSRWVAQPEFMRFAQAGDNFYGYYAAAMADVRTLAATLSVVGSGVRMGQIFKGTLRPEHPLALFHDLNRDAAPCADVPPEAALTYLRKGDPDAGLFAEGMNLVTCDGLPIGWLKRIGGRVNNMYPKELRIINL